MTSAPQSPSIPAPRLRGGRKPSARGELRSEEVLAAAAAIFQQKGYSAASLQDIADAVGLLKGSLYYYVRSKEDLLYQLTLRVHNDALANLERTEALAGDPIDKIRSLVRGHIKTLCGSTAMTQVFYYEYRHLSPDRLVEISAARRRYEAFLSELIVDGQRAGLLVEDLDASVASIGLLTMLNSIVMWFDTGGRVSTEEICVQYERLVLRSLGAAMEGRESKPRAKAKRAPGTTTKG